MTFTDPNRSALYDTLRDCPEAVYVSWFEAIVIGNLDRDLFRHLQISCGEDIFAFLLPEHREIVFGLQEKRGGPCYSDRPAPSGRKKLTADDALAWNALLMATAERHGEQLYQKLRGALTRQDRDQLHRHIESNIWSRWFLAKTISPFVEQHAANLDVLGIDLESVRLQAASYRRNYEGQGNPASKQPAAPKPGQSAAEPLPFAQSSPQSVNTPTTEPGKAAGKPARASTEFSFLGNFGTPSTSISSGQGSGPGVKTQPAAPTKTQVPSPRTTIILSGKVLDAIELKAHLSRLNEQAPQDSFERLVRNYDFLLGVISAVDLTIMEDAKRGVDGGLHPLNDIRDLAVARRLVLAKLIGAHPEHGTLKAVIQHRSQQPRPAHLLSDPAALFTSLCFDYPGLSGTPQANEHPATPASPAIPAPQMPHGDIEPGTVFLCQDTSPPPGPAPLPPPLPPLTKPIDPTPLTVAGQPRLPPPGSPPRPVAKTSTQGAPHPVTPAAQQTAARISSQPSTSPGSIATSPTPPNWLAKFVSATLVYIDQPIELYRNHCEAKAEQNARRKARYALLKAARKPHKPPPSTNPAATPLRSLLSIVVPSLLLIGAIIGILYTYMNWPYYMAALARQQAAPMQFVTAIVAEQVFASPEDALKNRRSVGVLTPGETYPMYSTIAKAGVVSIQVSTTDGVRLVWLRTTAPGIKIDVHGQ